MTLIKNNYFDSPLAVMDSARELVATAGMPGRSRIATLTPVLPC